MEKYKVEVTIKDENGKDVKGVSINNQLQNDSKVEFVLDFSKIMKEIELASIEPGEIFKIDDEEFILLEHFEDGTAACIRKELLKDEKIFNSENNNFQSSDLQKYLNGEYLSNLASSIGIDNIVEFEQDLISLDGLTDYGVTLNKVSLLTVDQYRKYRHLLGTIDACWWLITPWSTIADYSRGVCCVDSYGALSYGGCVYDRGVRPFCIFQSNI